MVRAFVCSVILAVAFSATAAAKEVPRTTLSVSPAILEWTVSPGDSMKKEVLVTNTTELPLPVSSVVKPFLLQDSDQADPAAAERYDTASWLTVEDGSFILKPEKTRKVTVTLKVPKDAEPGGHYATVYFSQPHPVDGAGAEARIGVLSFTTVKGEISKRLEGGSLVADFSGDTIAITALLHNAGNTHAMPTGEFAILNWHGEEVGRTRLSSGMVMPGTTRSYHSTFKHIGYGIYTIKPLLVDTEGRPLTLQGSIVFAFPWQYFLVGIVIVVLGWYGGYKIKDRWRRVFHVLTQRNF